VRDRYRVIVRNYAENTVPGRTGDRRAYADRIHPNSATFPAPHTSPLVRDLFRCYAPTTRRGVRRGKAMSVPDLGQQAGIRLYEAARAGEFHMSAYVARELASSCDRLVERVQQARTGAADLTRVTGFPDVPSGRALAAGIGAKGRQYLEVLDA